MRTGQRITGEYDEVEDRLRLAILDKSGQPLALWLTQRLANRLVRALVGLLDKQVSGEVTQQAAGQPTRQAAPATAAQQHQTVQYFEQTSADLRMSGSPPVQAPPDTMLGIATTVNIKAGGKQVVLEFRCGEEEGVELPMGLTALRQLLRVFYRLYQKADWARAGVWPDWFDEDAHRELLGPNQVN